MCIGIPMQVLSVREGFVLAQGRGEQRELCSLLIQPVQPGDWVLAFLDSAREGISPERAAEVNAVLDLLAGVMFGRPGVGGPGVGGPDGGPAGRLDHDPGFDLPSSSTAAELAQRFGGAVGAPPLN